MYESLDSMLFMRRSLMGKGLRRQRKDGNNSYADEGTKPIQRSQVKLSWRTIWNRNSKRTSRTNREREKVQIQSSSQDLLVICMGAACLTYSVPFLYCICGSDSQSKVSGTPRLGIHHPMAETRGARLEAREARAWSGPTQTFFHILSQPKRALLTRLESGSHMPLCQSRWTGVLRASSSLDAEGTLGQGSHNVW